MSAPSRWLTTQRGLQCVPQQSAKHSTGLFGRVQGQGGCWRNPDRSHKQAEPGDCRSHTHETPFPPCAAAAATAGGSPALMKVQPIQVQQAHQHAHSNIALALADSTCTASTN
jgi:hypothetical protein